MHVTRQRFPYPHIFLQFLVAMLAPIACLADSPTENEKIVNPYLDAEFSFSADPTKAILSVITQSNDFSRLSLILYGDGRLELENNRLGRWVRAVDIHEMEAILTTAVTHGLAEWDGDTINAQLLRDHGKPFVGRVDGINVHVLLVLDDYQRGTYKVDTVRRSISVDSPKFYAKHFPRIPQFEGVVEILAWMRDHLAQAQDSDK